MSASADAAPRGRRSATAGPPLQALPPRDPDGTVLAFVETPRGSRNKYKWDEERQLFVLHTTLPTGAVFPWDFGFIPGTKGGDGDPLDVLVLMDEPAFVGCLVPVRLIGVLEAEQREQGGKTERNDRLLAVATASHTHASLASAKDLPSEFCREVEHFFVSYNEARGKEFHPLGVHGPKRAEKLLDEAEERYRRERSSVH